MVSRLPENVNLASWSDLLDGLGGRCGGADFLFTAAEVGLLITSLSPTCWPCA